MLLIRGFEERVADLYRDGLIPGFVHLSIGQEASAVGACWPLRPADVITSTHRGHGHCLAKGLDPQGMFAELMAKDEGTNRGRGGSMHIADPRLGIFGANGIVAAGLPIANGAAVAAQLRGNDSVVVAFFGDGAAAQGAFHEALNLASVWRLPVIFFCENNGYSEFSPTRSQHAASLKRRAKGYALPYVPVDGNDVVATAICMQDMVVAARGRRTRPRGGIDLPLARALRGRSPALPDRGGAAGVAGTRSPRREPGPARRSRGGGVGDRRARVLRGHAVGRGRRAGARTRRSVGNHAVRLRRTRATLPTRTARPAADAPVYRTMDAIHMAPSKRSWSRTSGSSSPASTSVKAATSSA